MQMPFLLPSDFPTHLDGFLPRVLLMQLLSQATLKKKIKGSLNGKRFADDVLFLLIVTLLAIIFIVEIFTPFVIFLIAPGFVENDLKYNLAIEFSRITFPFLLFVSISSFFSGILNANNKFAAAAAAPIILNIVLIISLVISYISDSGYAKNLSYGVSLSGFIQMIFLAYYSKNTINQNSSY